jgi:putative ABC transport system permease protein
MSLPLRLLWRNWRSGELRILAFSLMMAVAVVCAIGVFTERLESALISESNGFLGADRIVRSSRPFDPALYLEATEAGVRHARLTSFSSMVFAGDDMHLASVKAVTAGYPLVGKLVISQVPFSSNPNEQQIATHVPPEGEAWVDSRFLPLLGVDLGDEVFVGEKSLRVTQVIISEPDRGDGFSLFGARLLMNASDLPATEVIQPGSRVRYEWLLAAPETLLNEYLEVLEPKLTENQKLVDLESAQQGLARTLKTGRQFLMLAGVIGVLLAGVAIAISSQRFAARHVDQVALFKSLGAGAWHIRQIYAIQLFVLALLASLVGIAVGEILQRGAGIFVYEMFNVELAQSGLKAYAIALLTGLVCLLFFSLPPLWHLPTVPPIKILRRDMDVAPLRGALQGALGVVAVLSLIYLYSGDLRLTGSVTLGFTVLVGLALLGATALLKVGRHLAAKKGHVWRLALASLDRRRAQSLVQILVFASALMLLLTLTTVRTSLIDEWRFQLPEDTPNHFLINIAQWQVQPVQDMMRAEGLSTEGLYPMVRGRIRSVNQIEPDEETRKQHESWNREVNLSWIETMPEENKILEGEWWDTWVQKNPGKTGVSVERGLAEGLELKLGDEMLFSLGGLEVTATIASFRELNWDSMRPNFYFLLSPGALDGFSPMYITSVFLAPEKKLLINQVLREYPTIVVIEMDRVIAQIRSIVERVSAGVEGVLLMVLASGLLVLFAAVNASMDSRMQEAALLRALGSRRQLILGSVAIEFSSLGFFAGLLAVVGSEILLFGLQRWVFDLPVQAHYFLWPVGPLVGSLLVGILGVYSCRRVLTVAPGEVLRELS